MSMSEIQECREITGKDMNSKVEVSVVCSSSQLLTNKPWCSPWLPAAPCSPHPHHTHTITDVTRIREGVAAYYTLTAHTGCLAWLGLFKRPRLNKQRGLCLCSRLISSHSVIAGCCSALDQSWNLPYPHMQTPRHESTALLRLQLWQDTDFVASKLFQGQHRETASDSYLSFC